ncbi:MAG: DNA gyrase inhibitor YacG [Chitinophagaceae bacterium]|nr:DNA gyrase inhibitor YacG [Oligoflexus sp.]
MASEDKVPAARIVRCPSCGKSTRYDQSNADRPFCSSRCKTMDIAQWADEGYRIPTKPGIDDDSEFEVPGRFNEEEDD